MKNPAEEMVTAWLQESKGFFTMNNIKVPKRQGGMGAEIDILATRGSRNVWVEVSVSTNPRCNYRKETRFESTIRDNLADFVREDKNAKVREFFGEKYQRWLIYGKLALSIPEKQKFESVMQDGGVRAIYFGQIFHELRELRGYRLDAARGYMNLFEAFHND